MENWKEAERGLVAYLMHSCTYTTENIRLTFPLVTLTAADGWFIVLCNYFTVKTSGYFMCHQFNIQISLFKSIHTKCFARISEQRAVFPYTTLIDWFLGEFAKFRKATVSFVMSVRPSVRMEQIGSLWTAFHEIWYLSIFRKYVERFQVH